MAGYNYITIANKDFKVSKINDEIKRAEAFIAKKFAEMQKEHPDKFKKVGKNKKKVKGESIEYEVLQLLMAITMEYLEEKSKIEDLKKEMIVKIDSIINRIELLL